MSASVAHDARVLPALSRIVAANIKAELAYRDLKHGDLAGYLGVTQAAVSMKLRGDRAIGLDELAPIAEYFGLEPSDLLRPRHPQPAGPAAAVCPRQDSNLQPTDHSSEVIYLDAHRERRDDVDDIAGWVAPVTPLPTAVAR